MCTCHELQTMEFHKEKGLGLLTPGRTFLISFSSLLFALLFSLSHFKIWDAPNSASQNHHHCSGVVLISWISKIQRLRESLILLKVKEKKYQKDFRKSSRKLKVEVLSPANATISPAQKSRISASWGIIATFSRNHREDNNSRCFKRKNISKVISKVIPLLLLLFSTPCANGQGRAGRHRIRKRECSWEFASQPGEYWPAGPRLFRLELYTTIKKSN